MEKQWVLCAQLTPIILICRHQSSTRWPVLSQILYGLDVVAGATAHIFSRLSRILYFIVYYVYNIRGWAYTTEHVKRFLGCNFDQFVLCRNLFHFYGVIKFGLPLHLHSTSVLTSSTRSLQIIIPLIRCCFERSFLVRVTRRWNLLPRDLRIFSNSNNAFRVKLLRYFCTLEYGTHLSLTLILGCDANAKFRTVYRRQCRALINLYPI